MSKAESTLEFILLNADAMEDGLVEAAKDLKLTFEQDTSEGNIDRLTLAVMEMLETHGYSASMMGYVPNAYN